MKCEVYGLCFCVFCEDIIVIEVKVEYIVFVFDWIIFAVVIFGVTSEFVE